LEKNLYNIYGRSIFRTKKDSIFKKLYEEVFEYAGCLGDAPEFLLKGDYVDKIYFLETLLLYLTEQPNSKIILYEDTKKKVDKTFCSSK